MLKEINTLKNMGLYVINKYTYSQILLYLDSYKNETDNPEIQKHIETLLKYLRKA